MDSLKPEDTVDEQEGDPRYQANMALSSSPGSTQMAGCCRFMKPGALPWE